MRKVFLGLTFSLIFLAAALGLVQWSRYETYHSVFPQSSRLGGIPVDGLTPEEAADRLKAVYTAPVELRIGEDAVHLMPESLGFRVNVEAMLDQARMAWMERPALAGYWDYLWNRNGSEIDIPLDAIFDPQQAAAYLEQEVLPRYAYPASPGAWLAGTRTFTAGQPGRSLEKQGVIERLEAALRSPEERSIRIEVNESDAPPVPVAELEYSLRSALQAARFRGVVELYFHDLRHDRVLHFALNRGQEIDTGVAFTAASTMKIPIMVSTLLRTEEPPSDAVQSWFERMIVYSENPPADSLMKQIDEIAGPLRVTDDLHALGLENSFIAGYFALGSPLLNIYETPANRRTDVNLSPDIYNQTTPEEIGLLLEAIYRCAAGEPNRFEEVFPGRLMQSECELMISYLRENKIGALIEAGLAEGTPLAHKHGWIEESDGLLHSLSDVGIVFTPGGDYVLAVYLWDPEQLLFTQANALVAEIANLTYNFMNPDQPAPWYFGEVRYR